MQNPVLMQRLLDSVTTIPTLPTVIEKITRLLQNPQTSAEEVGKVITTDQAIASKVLKLVNSAFYGFPGKISTITHAIVILGFSTVKNIVLTASIFDFYKKKGGSFTGFDMEKFWVHSIACGAAAQAIARHVGHSDKEECFIGGLIHDMGKIIMCQYLPQEFGAVITRVAEKKCLFIEAEQELFGITHQEIGSTVAERWNLPRNLQDVVRYHHNPTASREYSATAGIIHSADIFIRALDHGFGGDYGIPTMNEQTWTQLGFPSVSLSALLDAIDEEIDKAQALLSLV